MTLKVLKSHLRTSSILSFLIIYGIGFYFLGKSASLPALISKYKDKPVASKIDSPIQSPRPNEDAQSTSVIGAFVKLCSNSTSGFEISYPKDWFTTYNEEEQKCRFFAPFSFVVPQDVEGDFVPVKIELENPQSWQETVKFYSNPNDFTNVNSVQNLEINGKLVQKIKATTTDQGQLPMNLAKIIYLVFDGAKPLVISYGQLTENEDVENFEKILEQMVGSLQFF